jgi:selenocysteine lyase/cysteine desulfurase
VQIALVDNRFRISPSVFNGMSDVERLIEALS